MSQMFRPSGNVAVWEGNYYYYDYRYTSAEENQRGSILDETML